MTLLHQDRIDELLAHFRKPLADFVGTESARETFHVRHEINLP